jgi:2,4-dienoyl-CoA reductase-like NADH-dependent reductase (Old Yellow Enzyme family)
MNYPTLFSPLQVGRQTILNRATLPATLTNYGQGNLVTERWQNFFIKRAKGGGGLIVSEIIAVDPEALAHRAAIHGGHLTALALYISRPNTHIPTKTVLAQLERRRER